MQYHQKTGQMDGNLNGKMMEEDNDGGIQWAGSHHTRNNFNKKKDYLADWTNVLFRAWMKEGQHKQAARIHQVILVTITSILSFS